VAKGKGKSAEQTPPPPLILDTTTRFDNDVKRQETRGKSLYKLHAIIEGLRNRVPLDPNHKDHPLGGDRKGWRDCHIEPDWVLIYQKDDVTLTLGRTGSHSDLFD